MVAPRPRSSTWWTTMTEHEGRCHVVAKAVETLRQLATESDDYAVEIAGQLETYVGRWIAQQPDYQKFSDTRRHIADGSTGLTHEQQVHYLLEQTARLEQQVNYLQDERAANYESWWRLGDCHPGLSGMQPECAALMDQTMGHYAQIKRVLERLRDAIPELGLGGLIDRLMSEESTR